MKKTAIILSALLLAAPLPVYAMNENEAKDAADEYVPEGFTFKEAEMDGRNWEVDYLSADAEFEVTLDQNGVLKETEYELLTKSASKRFALKKTDVKKIIRKQFGPLKSITVTRKTSRKKGRYYKVIFKTAAVRGEAEISGDTGTIWEYELKYTAKK